FHQLHTRHGGQGFPRKVVLGRAEATGGDDEVGAITGDLEAGDVVGEVVGDGGVEPDLDADLGELAAEPLSVRVEGLAGGQLAADGDGLGLHGAGLGSVLNCRRGGGMPRGTMKTSYYLAAAAVFAAAGVAVYAQLPQVPPPLPPANPAPPAKTPSLPS